MKVCFDPYAWEDYLYWQETSPVILQRLNGLITEIRHNPQAVRKRAAYLRGEFEGLHSLPLNPGHRLIYSVRDGVLMVLQCRYHGE